jgi:CheY-like chemotaxis protein
LRRWYAWRSPRAARFNHAYWKRGEILEIDLRQRRRRTKLYCHRMVGSNNGRQRPRDNALAGPASSRPLEKEPTVPLDAMPSSTSDQPQSNPSTPREGEERQRLIAVAVVDDDAAVHDSTQVLLEALDFEVHTYANAAEFLAASPNVACVIADYHMPGLNGLELAAELRRRGSTVPVIMITAMSDPRIDSRAAELGIKSVLKKPLGKGLIAALQSELG